MPALYSGAPERALAVYAHPDDAEISCGGTLARWAAAGSEVTLVICAAGDKGSSNPAVDVERLIETRAEEVDAAAAILGLAGVRRLGRRDGEFENDLQLRGDLVGLIREHRPDSVVCPDPLAVFFGSTYFNHRDHRIVGWAALDAVAPAAASPLYFPERGSAHQVSAVFLSGSLDADVYVDVASSIEVKAEAVLCHRSQLDPDPSWLRSVVYERSEEAGRRAGVVFAEGFRRIELA